MQIEVLIQRSKTFSHLFKHDLAVKIAKFDGKMHPTVLDFWCVSAENQCLQWV